MPTVTRHVRIKAAPSRVWETLAAFDQLDKWLPSARRVTIVSDEQKGVGATREIALAATTLLERVVLWDEGHRLAYSVSGGGMAIAWRSHEWTITSGQGGVGVTLTINLGMRFSVIGWALYRLWVEQQIVETAETLLAGLKAYLETRRPATPDQITQMRNQVTTVT